MPQEIESHHARPEVVEAMVASALDGFRVHDPTVGDLASACLTLTARIVNTLMNATANNPVAHEHNRAMLEDALVKIWERVRSKGSVQ